MRKACAAPTFWILMLVIILSCVAFSLACQLTTIPIGLQEESLVVKVFSLTRIAFSDQLFLEADRYFHRGIGPYRQEKLSNWFTTMHHVIKPCGHFHLHDAAVDEIMPWLYFSTRMNRHNVTAYIVAAFFLVRDCRRPDLAEQVLREAQMHNPYNYQVYLEQGRVALKQGKFKSATRAFDAALRLLSDMENPEDIEHCIDKAAICTFRGLLYETTGEIEQALTCYKSVLDMFPDREGLKERVSQLETNARASISPDVIWQNMIGIHRYVCGAEEDTHH